MKQLNQKKFLELLLFGFFIFLPFERILTLEISGLTAKISFIILLIIIIIFFSTLRKIILTTEEKFLLTFSTLSFLSIGFLTLRRIAKENGRIEIIKKILIYAGAVLSLFALWQYFADLYNLPFSFLRPQYSKLIFGFPRPQATFLEPLYFANFLFLPFYFNLEKILSEKRVGWFFILNQILISMVFVLTLSRGAYLGVLGSLFLLLIVILIKFQQNLKRFFLGLFLSVVGVLLAVALIYFTVPTKQDFRLFLAHSSAADVQTGESTVDRFYTSQIAVEKFLTSPWGIGTGAFGALPEFRDKISISGYQTVNNLYLEILIEEGILGLLLFVGFLFLIIKSQIFRLGEPQARRASLISQNFSPVIYLSILFALLIQATTLAPIYLLPFWAFLALV
ncbi:MAG: O-antigen polymerase [Candidatus Berkelbacteria bacterium Athens1014_28]|uniref:O-antigen polymerase n=1 Tax=Candidatus Berkelbacteria bacterium Athens1014_28 TaxID=2017145 RepID=A0A554LI70_9BACT|nr:MAG: O-antigen polymerase [Candidatus Berkelbacteria bacterium Athens1014_28]